MAFIKKKEDLEMVESHIESTQIRCCAIARGSNQNNYFFFLNTLSDSDSKYNYHLKRLGIGLKSETYSNFVDLEKIKNKYSNRKNQEFGY